MSNDNRDRDGMQSFPSQGSRHWDNLSERRLDDMNAQLRDARQDVANLWGELRKEIRAGDNREGLLRRLDERLTDMSRRVEEWRSDAKAADDAMRKAFVTKEEFDPVKKAVFTMIGALCLAVLAAVARLVMK